MRTIIGTLTGALLALFVGTAAQEGVYRLGGGAPNNVELMSDGKVYFRISPAGLITMPNGASFPSVSSSSDIAYAAGNFTAGGTQTWTVAQADVGAHHWVRTGNVVMLNWQINTTTVAGTPHAQLRVGTGGLTWSKLCESSYYYIDNGTRGSGRATASPSTTYVVLNIASAGSWAAATDTTYVYGQITCEVS